MVAMAGSRSFFERLNGATAPSHASPPTGRQAELGVMVGAPVSGPSNFELQQQVKELQQQVRELVRLQTLQVGAAATSAAAAHIAPATASPTSEASQERP